MIARVSQRTFAPRGIQVRLNSSLPVPPKIATPKSVQGPGGSSARMDEVVGFYKSLPKGPTAVKKGPFTNPGNGKPLVIAIGSLLLGAYTMDYMNHLSKYHDRGPEIEAISISLPAQVPSNHRLLASPSSPGFHKNRAH